MSGASERLEARRAELVARAAAERRALAEQLAPLATLDKGLERLEAMKLQLPTTVLGTGLALSAMLIALPVGRSSIVRGGIAMIQLAASVKRLFTRGGAQPGS